VLFFFFVHRLARSRYAGRTVYGNNKMQVRMYGVFGFTARWTRPAGRAVFFLIGTKDVSSQREGLR